MQHRAFTSTFRISVVMGFFESRDGMDGLPGGYSEWEPPDPIPNSEVKTLSADDSVGSPHVKVGHCQALYPSLRLTAGGFLFCVGRPAYYRVGLT